MKILKKDGTVEDAKIKHYANEDQEEIYYIDWEGEKCGSIEALIMTDNKLVYIDPQEVNDLFLWFNDARYHIFSTNEFFLGRESAFSEIEQMNEEQPEVTDTLKEKKNYIKTAKAKIKELEERICYVQNDIIEQEIKKNKKKFDNPEDKGV